MPELESPAPRKSWSSKGGKVGEEWFTTSKVENALYRYHEAKAKIKVLRLLRGLSADLETKINILVFSSLLLVIAKSLFGHVSEERRRDWVFPTLKSEDKRSEKFAYEIELTGLSPYWFDAAQGNAIQNTIKMQSLFLLTGPNGGDKSSLLRSICAAALLEICGLMVPADSAIIPHFDSVMLHMKTYDSPSDGKSSFQIEMSEIRSVVAGATRRSLVLVDEICRGTETAKGTCIAGIDGVCRESLAFETALKEGVTEKIIRRAEELYLTMNTRNASSTTVGIEPNKVTIASLLSACGQSHALDGGR